jgi:hypothetical protein
MQTAFVALPHSGEGTTRRQLLDHWQNLFSDEDSEQTDKGYNRRRRGPNLKNGINNPY